MKKVPLIIMLICISASSVPQCILDSISFNYISNDIIINAKIDGKNCKLLFDTGDPLTRVFPSSFGWQAAIRNDKEIATKLKKVSVQIDSYSQQVDVFEYNEGAHACQTEIDGCIGYNFMKDKIWMIDYRREKIYILSSAPIINKSIPVIPIFVMAGNGLWKELLAKVKINGSSYVVKRRGVNTEPLLKFDTGFSSRSGTVGLFMNKDFLVEKCNAKDSLRCSEYCGMQICSIKPVEVEFSFENNVTFSTLASGDNGVGQILLGNAFFDKYKPVFDLKNNQLILLPNE
jgi:hypothetical protein